MLKIQNLGRRVVPFERGSLATVGHGYPTGRPASTMLGPTGGGHGWRGRRRAFTGDVDLGGCDGSSTRRPPSGLAKTTMACIGR
jgi:hypothetical protein